MEHGTGGAHSGGRRTGMVPSYTECRALTSVNVLWSSCCSHPTQLLEIYAQFFYEVLMHYRSLPIRDI